MRHAPSFLLILGLLACSAEGKDSDGVGPERADEVLLSLQPVAGVTLNTVHYVVTQSGQPGIVAEGTLPVQGAGESLRLGLGLPVGVGYRLSLVGIPMEGEGLITCTGSVGPFDVMLGAAPPLNIAFVCVDTRTGAASPGLDVESEACPELSLGAVTALPSRLTVGSSALLAASASDARGAVIRYQWALDHLGAALLATPSLAQTALTCLAPADSLRASVTAFNGQCDVTAEVLVSCVAP